MTIQAITQADPGWLSLQLKTRPTSPLDIEDVKVGPVACWALFSDGTVQGLIAQDENIVSAERFPYDAEKNPNGHYRYIHVSELGEAAAVDPQQAALEFMMLAFDKSRQEAQQASGTTIASTPGARTTR